MARKSKAEQVHDALLDEICRGLLEPGRKLVEEEIAERLGVSRTPVREALRRLESMGLIRFRTHHGAEVARLGRAAMLQLFDALAELGPACAERAAAALTDSHRCQLGQLAPAGTVQRSDGLMALVHQAAGSPVLVEMSESVCHRLAPYWRMAQGRVPQWAESGMAARAKLILALMHGQPQKARDAMRAWVLITRDAADRSLELLP
jgi:DNA-binding GntR family transcriptional regulator